MNAKKAKAIRKCLRVTQSMSEYKTAKQNYNKLNKEHRDIPADDWGRDILLMI